MTAEAPDSETPQDTFLTFAPSEFEAGLQQLLALADLREMRHALVHLRDAWFAPERSSESGTNAGLNFPRSFLEAAFAQIGESLTIERARYYVERLQRAAGEPRTNGVNDLDLHRWKAYSDIQTDSLWNIDRRDGTGAHTAGYWGNFVPQIPNQMMRRYTRKGDWVLDAFAGSGTTLIEARRLGRNCIGMELQEHVAEQARANIEAEPNKHAIASKLYVGDSTTTDFVALLRDHNQTHAQLALLHPPYHDIIKFSDDARDLSNAGSIEAFLAQLRQVATNTAPALAQGGYLVLVIGDKYAKGEWHPLGFQAMQVVQEQGFTLKSIVVKNFEETTGKRAQKELWRYRALVGGFFVFKHEYIFVFEKR